MKNKPKEEKQEEPKKITFPDSKFDLYSFKTLYVNETDKEKAFQFFLNNFDSNGFSVWHMIYDKLEDECVNEIPTLNMQ